MKDTIITKEQKKRELFYLLVSFCLSNGLNLFSILFYNTSMKEVYSMQHIVLLLTLIIYAVLLFLRGIVYFIRK